MKEWPYRDEVPFIPVTLLGKDHNIKEFALVDTGARLCVLHEDYRKDLDLDRIEQSYTAGFGSKKKIPVDLCIISLEINGRIENVQCIILKERYYPDALPRVVLGRNLLNKFRVILDGKEKKIYVDD